jgi:FKBP-type peptidyl-prolyl cis-trans isomerase (trigger factor)
MSSNVETLGNLERRVSMSVPAEDIEKQVDERLKKMARNVRMPGFRPGKVPMKIIAQTYGGRRAEIVQRRGARREVEGGRLPAYREKRCFQ